MITDISGRGFPVTEPLRQSVEDKLAKLGEKNSLKILSAKAVLSVEKDRCSADMEVSGKDFDFASSASGYEMYQVIDEAMDKIGTQMNKLLDKLRSRKGIPLREATGPEEKK